MAFRGCGLAKPSDLPRVFSVSGCAKHSDVSAGMAEENRAGVVWKKKKNFKPAPGQSWPEMSPLPCSCAASTCLSDDYMCV
eukprot:2794070-Amphidinium_carterae.1